MSADEIHVGDKGTRFAATIYDGTSVVDISGASSRLFVFRKPDGSLYTATASLTTGGTDGAMHFDVDTTTTLDQDGKWKLQATVVLSGSVFHSDIYPFRVHPNLS